MPDISFHKNGKTDLIISGTGEETNYVVTLNGEKQISFSPSTQGDTFTQSLSDTQVLTLEIRDGFGDFRGDEISVRHIDDNIVLSSVTFYPDTGVYTFRSDLMSGEAHVNSNGAYLYTGSVETRDNPYTKRLISEVPFEENRPDTNTKTAFKFDEDFDAGVYITKEGGLVVSSQSGDAFITSPDWKTITGVDNKDQDILNIFKIDTIVGEEKDIVSVLRQNGVSVAEDQSLNSKAISDHIQAVKLEANTLSLGY